MSADNCIAIGRFKDSDGYFAYRVIHAQAIENCDYSDSYPNELTDAYSVCYYGEAEELSSPTNASVIARILADEIEYLEYGILSLEYDVPLLSISAEEAQQQIDKYWAISKKVLICTIGFPRSGKSTWALKQNNPIVNPDSIRLALHGQRYRSESEPMVWAIAKTMVRSLFLAGHNTVILDATSITREQRDQWICDDWATKFKHIRTSSEECIKRALEKKDTEIIPVIKHMKNIWEPLGIHERVYREDNFINY